MTRRHLRTCGLTLFVIGLIMVSVGAMTFAFGGSFLYSGIAFGVILLSFVLLSMGSRVGDKQ